MAEQREFESEGEFFEGLFSETFQKTFQTTALAPPLPAHPLFLWHFSIQKAFLPSSKKTSLVNLSFYVDQYNLEQLGDLHLGNQTRSLFLLYLGEWHFSQRENRLAGGYVAQDPTSQWLVSHQPT